MEEDKEILHILVSSNEAIFLEDKKEKLKGANVDREQRQVWWYLESAYKHLI